MEHEEEEFTTAPSNDRFLPVNAFGDNNSRISRCDVDRFCEFTYLCPSS